MRRAFIFGAAIALAFVAGGYLGYRLGKNGLGWIDAVGETFLANQYAMGQYKEADYNTAVEALESYIAYLARFAPLERPWVKGQNPWLDARGLAFDQALAWARLAMLHERNNNQAASDAAWRQAQSLFAQTNWRDTSIDHLRNVLARLDR